MAKAASGLFYWGDCNHERHDGREWGREEGELRIEVVSADGADGGNRYGWALTDFPRQGSVPSLFLNDKKSEN